MKSLIPVRAAAAVVFLLCALHAAAECDKPPLLQVSLEPHPEEGYTYAVITTQYVPTMLIYEDGKSWSTLPFTPAATINHRVNTFCLAKPMELKVVAHGSPGCEDAIVRTMIDPADSTPELWTNITPTDTFTHVGISWKWKGSFGTLKGVFFGADSGGPETVLSLTSGENEGGRSTGSGRPGMFVFEGVSCVGMRARVVVPTASECAEEGKCFEKVGKPVHTISGNMEAADDDPLPGFGDPIPFQRKYNSFSNLNGFFGSRWSSILNASVHLYAGAGAEWVSLITESGTQYLFESTDAGVYVQRMPDGASHATYLSKQTDGSWIHTDRDRQLVRFFDAGGNRSASATATLAGRSSSIGRTDGPFT